VVLSPGRTPDADSDAGTRAGTAPGRAAALATPPARRTRVLALAEARWAGAALILFGAGLAVQLPGGPAWLYWTLFLACYAAGGWEPGLAGLQALREKTLDVDLLMVAAAIGAAALGQVLDGALLIVIFATSGALEALATARTEDSVRGLLDLAPETATLISRDGSVPGGTAQPGSTDSADSTGSERVIAAADLEVGDLVLVRPGDRVPADGVVEAGASEVDQATITGEPLPADKAPGDDVFAGTVNGTGALRIRVGKRAGDSVVARIAALVEQATQTKARTQLFIEKVEQRYSIGMVTVTVLLFALPLLWGEPVTASLLRAMTFMIVASPCAVVLATMPPLLASIANAGRHGVLAKSAVVMEQLGATTRVAFDKTGTLTHGTPELASVRLLRETDRGEAVPDEQALSEDDVLRLAAAAEYGSEHPLAAAIVRAARDRGITLPEAEEFEAEPGRGVTARIEGRLVRVGSPAAIPSGSNGSGSGSSSSSSDHPAVQDIQAAGQTAVILACDGRPVAVLGITDRMRDEAPGAVAALTRLTGAAPVLLTGDNAVTAAGLARAAGITDVRAGLLPADKVAAVRELAGDGHKDGGHRVTVVGDGINDAPALAAAHAGIAMGGAGSDLTLQAADAIVVRDDLAAIPAAIALSRRARRVVTANLVIAAVFITGLVLWDLAGHLPLPLGVAGHEGSTVIVGLNGLRLLRPAAWRRALAE
jgi:heavy metal translocating P-type ATPase